jgi:hypothetical protein
MGTRANIAIRYNEAQYSPNYLQYSDLILLYRHYDGYPQEIDGCINMFVRAYDHASGKEKIGLGCDNLGGLATSLILISDGEFEPVSSQVYEEFYKYGHFMDASYVYHIVFEDGYHKKHDAVISVTKVGDPDVPELNRPLEDWRKFNDVIVAWNSMVKERVSPGSNGEDRAENAEIAGSLYFDEVSARMLKPIYRELGSCPCDTCLVRAACTYRESSVDGDLYRRIRDKCENKLKYERKVKQYLSGQLSDDKELRDLLRKSISE